MESFNLKTASTYLNNLLLARGLLRDGKTIEFARPSKGEGGSEATMVQIINLVHDMILRRDGEQEQRETIAQTLRNLRTESSANALGLERLQTRHDDVMRQLSLCQSQERVARASSRTAEAGARALREELIRLKATVAQIRTSCANDVRKRDVQIQRLKTHLTTQQRGNKTGMVGPSITISPGASGLGNSNSLGRDDDGPPMEDTEYNLRQETTEFLTQLSQSLSDENDNLIGLVRSTLATLRELQGLPENAQRAANLNTNGPEEDEGEEQMLQALPTSYYALATDMDNVLENLRSILTNPNFVPIEEVAIREEEIQKLRAGWEKMEGKWREAILMMDGWRKRMLNGGDTVNLEEIKRGLGLGKDLNVRTNGVSGAAFHATVDDYVEDGDDDIGIPSDEQSGDDAAALIESDDISDVIAATSDRQRPNKPLIEGHGNSKSSPRKIPLKHEAPDRLDTTPDENNPHQSLGKVSKGSPGPKKKSTGSRTGIPRPPQKTLKRLSSPSPHPKERSPKLTVQEKLNVAQAEAEAAAIAAGLKLEEIEASFDEHADKKVKGTRKTRINGKPRRRKSTLTPDELERLMLV